MSEFISRARETVDSELELASSFAGHTLERNLSATANWRRAHANHPTARSITVGHLNQLLLARKRPVLMSE